MNRFAEVGSSLVNLDVSVASHSQQLIHGIDDQRSGSLFIFGLCVLRAVDFYRFMLSFRDLEREYPGLEFEVHHLEPCTIPAVTFRGVIPPRPEKERKIRVSEQSQVDTASESARASDKTDLALGHAS
jgi:hypothetical protein